MTQIIKSSTKETSISLKGSDIGTLYIVQHELLKDQQVDFAGVILRHPLTNEYWMRVNAKGSPIKEIIKGYRFCNRVCRSDETTYSFKIQGCLDAILPQVWHTTKERNLSKMRLY